MPSSPTTLVAAATPLLLGLGCVDDTIYGPMALGYPLLEDTVTLDYDDLSPVRLEIIEKRVVYAGWPPGSDVLVECPRKEPCGETSLPAVEIHTRPFEGAYLAIGPHAAYFYDGRVDCVDEAIGSVVPIDDVEPDRFIFLIPTWEDTYDRCLFPVDYTLRAGTPAIDTDPGDRWGS